MCGYCFEKIFVFPFVESQKKDEIFEIEDIGVSNYIQESANLLEIIGKTKHNPSFKHSIAIVFCRLYEQYIVHGFDISFYNKIVSAFGQNSVESYLSAKQKFYENQLWQELGKTKLYTDKHTWSRFTRNRKHLLAETSDMLHSYYDWWIMGKNKEFSDPVQRLEQKGIMDPIEDTTPDDWEKFYAKFPVFFFSLTFLTQYHRKSELLIKIALNCPHDVPMFEGNDLWLQRKAFACCVREYGTEFIIDNLKQIRIELIFYVLLKLNFHLSELRKLKNVLFSGTDQFACLDDELKMVSELIDRLISEKA